MGNGYADTAISPVGTAITLMSIAIGLLYGLWESRHGR